MMIPVMALAMKFCVVCGQYVESDHAHEIEDQLPVNVKLEFGKKNKYGSDIILFLNGFKVSMVELGIAVGFIYRNEERIYPPSQGFEGGKRFKRFINDCMDIGFPTKELRRKFLL